MCDGILVGMSCIGLLRLRRRLLFLGRGCLWLVGDVCRSGDGVGRGGEVVVAVWVYLLLRRRLR